MDQVHFVPSTSVELTDRLAFVDINRAFLLLIVQCDNCELRCRGTIGRHERKRLGNVIEKDPKNASAPAVLVVRAAPGQLDRLFR